MSPSEISTYTLSFCPQLFLLFHGWTWNKPSAFENHSTHHVGTVSALAALRLTTQVILTICAHEETIVFPTVLEARAPTHLHPTKRQHSQQCEGKPCVGEERESTAARYLTAQHVVSRGSESPGFRPWLSTLETSAVSVLFFVFFYPSSKRQTCHSRGKKNKMSSWFGCDEHTFQ